MDGCQTPRLDWECVQCNAHRFNCVDCGDLCIEDGGGCELCELCFRSREQKTELDQLKRGEYVLMPVSLNHAKAMLLVAKRYLADNSAD